MLHPVSRSAGRGATAIWPKIESMLIHVNTGIYTCFYMQKRHYCRVEFHLNSASPRQSRIRRPNIWRIDLFSTSQSLEMTQSPLFNARKKWQDLEVNFYTTWYHMLYIYDCLNQACFADIGQEAEVGSSGFWRFACAESSTKLWSNWSNLEH